MNENQDQEKDPLKRQDIDFTVVEQDTDDTPLASPSPKPLAITHKRKWYSYLSPEHVFIPPLRRRLGRSARPLGVVIVLIIVIAIGEGSYVGLSAKHVTKAKVVDSSFKLPVAKFKLVSTIPASNATDVSTAANIVLNFNQPVTASKMINNMFVTPSVTGTYTQGSNSDQLVFTPSRPFAQGTKFGIMVNGTYENKGGSQLGSPYMYNFTTSIPADGIEFEDQNGLIDNLTSLESGQKETYNLFVGSDIGSGATITLYQGDTDDMLNSLVYTNTTEYGFTTPEFNNLAVPTTNLKQISSQANITSNSTFSVQQPDGVYVAIATNAAGKEVGMVWIDFSSFGVLLRQDDQKIVLDAQSFKDSQDVSVTAELYNLDDHVNLLGRDTVDGLTTDNVAFSPSLDVVVATDGNETAVVPVNIPNSGGDIRVDQDLSTAQQVYGVTDKSTYQAGTSIQYAGYVRNDDDAQYVNPASGKVELYVAQYKGGTPLASFNATVDANGMFSGTLPTSDQWLTSGDAFDQFQIFASEEGENSQNDIPIASFTLTSQLNASTNLTVSFSKPSYLSSDTITVTVTGTNTDGTPLANTTVQMHTFAQDYYENNPALNLENFGTTGTELPTSPTSIKLNSKGQATYTVNVSSLPNDGTSQLVTLQANLPNQSGVGAAGGASAIIHQGDGVLTFGTDRNTIPTGDDLTAEVYAQQLSNNSAITNSTVNYALIDVSSGATLTTGSAVTNGSGEASIDIPSSILSKTDGMDLKVSMVDENGNTIQATSSYDVSIAQDEIYDTSGAGLQDLDISGSSTNISIGDQVKLNIDSPANIRAIVTMDRGRIYNPSMVNLSQGNNAYDFTVDTDLAPSFTLTFSYFLNGYYHSEGVNFDVNNQSQVANVKITPASQSVTAGQPTTVQLSTTDSDNDPVQTDLIVDVVSTNGYDLTSQVNPNIFSTLFDPRPIMTSSASSLSPIGSGGGRCGGGGGDLPGFANAIGTTLDWQPELITSASGQASVTFTPPSGSWTISAYAMSANTQVGYSSTSIDAN